MKKNRGIGRQQKDFLQTHWQHRLSHGGELRRKRLGRGFRPLSCRDPLHLVFKIDRTVFRPKGLRCPQCFHLIHKIVKRYSLRFWVKIEQISIQGDHIHLLVRAPRRAKYQDFFRVVAGQIAQRFEKEGLIRVNVTDTPDQIIRKGTGLWKHRPFSRVVRGWRAYKIVRDYIQLNEREALGEIPYRKSRLRGLTQRDWGILWSSATS